MKTYHFKTGLLLLATALFSMTACSNEDHEDVLAHWTWDSDPEPTPEPDGKDPNPKIIAQGWTNVTADFEGLPEYINVYKKSKTSDDKGAVAFIAVADMTKAKFEISNDIHWSDAASGNGNEALYTPTEFYNNNGKPAIVINGGLFFESGGFYYSQSAAYSNGVMLCPNQNYYSENWVDFWYPTLGFFYQDKATGQFHATWTYYANDGCDYSYADCKVIDFDVPETANPTATSPSQGTKLNNGETVKDGIGGVGVLVHDGIIRNTWQYEMLDVSADSNQPRTAVGYAKEDNKLVFFVCEGRNMTEGVAGMTTGEVALQLSAIGCTEALNLDGGGSSCMLVNGKETIKGSDGRQRKVIDACFIR